MCPAAAINSLPGVSSGDVIKTMQGLAERELPQNMNAEWSDLSFLQKQSSKIEQLRDLQQNPISAFVTAKAKTPTRRVRRSRRSVRAP